MDQNLVSSGIVLVILGLVIGLTGIAYASKKPPRHVDRSGEKRERRIRGGGVIIIGPFPMIFGSDPKTAKVLLILAITLVTLLVAVFIASLLF